METILLEKVLDSGETLVLQEIPSEYNPSGVDLELVLSRDGNLIDKTSCVASSYVLRADYERYFAAIQNMRQFRYVDSDLLTSAIFREEPSPQLLDQFLSRLKTLQ